MEAFENYFKEADKDKDGKIGMVEGIFFFSGFGLPSEVIAQIWMYVDHDKSGILGRPEFFNALRLVTVAQIGRALTPEIVKFALDGPLAAKIPAPQMTSVGPTPAPQLTPSPAMPQDDNPAVSPSIAIEEGDNNNDFLSLNRDDDFDVRSLHKPRLGSQGSTSAREQGNIEDICTKLQVALADAAKCRFCKCEEAEMDLVSLIQKVEESENALLKELDLSESRLDLLQEENKKLQEERDNAVKEVEELDSSLDLLQEENKKLQEERDNAVEELDSSLDLLQEENKKLQEERDNAVKEVEELELSLDLLQEENKKLQERDNAVKEVEELDLGLDFLQEENKKLQERDNAVKEVEELDLSLDLLQEENKKLQEERDNAVKEMEELDLSLDLLQEENKKLQEERDKAVKEVEKLRAGAGPGSYEAFSKFSLLELQQATENFNNSHKIGEGGFGCVYKGFLRNIMVAIKMLHPESLQGKPEFEQEVAILSTMRHPNLVTLIGTCSEQSALVYEYLPNGSLEDRLACQGGTPPLTWQVRTRIIGEICRALLFLHSNNPNPIVHGDLNPANILLDANLVSKLSDFGISRLLIESNTNTLVYRTEYPKGTFAYMDPEFLRSGQITVKSDVYSFGIIVLRLLTGKPPVNIIADVEDAVETDSLHLIIDESAGEWPFVQAKQLTNLGLRCTQMRRRKRPDLESEWKLVESLMMAASLSVLPSFKSQLDDKGIPSYFMCPIFQEVMKDPHIAADGYTYEAEAIKGWLDGEHKTSPMTNLPLVHLELTPNHALRSAIQEWLQHHQ